MKIRYVGLYASVQIAATGQTAERGKTIDVPTDIGRALVKQASWKRVPTKKKES